MAADGTRREGPRALAEAIGRVASPLYDRRGFAGSALIGDWPAIVGDRLAAESVPERLQFPPKRRSGGTLSLRIANSGLALELQHLQTQLIERINGYFGHAAVAQVRFIHGPLPAKPPPRVGSVSPPAAEPPSDADAKALAEMVEGIRDPDLRDALQSLGQAIFSPRDPTSGASAGTSAAGRGEGGKDPT